MQNLHENKIVYYETWKNNKSFFNKQEISFNRQDLHLTEKFLKQLRESKGDWSKHGIQRIIRLYSECSDNYLSICNPKIREDVPVSEAFPYSKFCEIYLYTFSDSLIST